MQSDSINSNGIGKRRPPLPFVGNKCRWWNELSEIARSLPAGFRVLDAFGGSFSISRIMKDANPDLDITTNDYNGEYMARLESIGDTAERLRMMWEILEKYGEARGGAKRWHFLKFNSEECRSEVMSVASAGADKKTLYGYLSGSVRTCNADGNFRTTIINKIPATMPFSADMAAQWVDGLNIRPSGVLNSCDARRDAKAFDLVICDPPYTGNGKMYMGCEEAARRYTLEIIGTCKQFCAFDTRGPPIHRAAVNFGGPALRIFEGNRFSGRNSIGGEYMYLKL